LNEVLLTAGVASIILAVVGGGAKAFGVEVPVLDSRSRQVALALVGVLFLIGSYLARPATDGDGKDVIAYRAEVRATCQALQDAGSNPILAASNDNGTFDRAKLIHGFKQQVSASSATLDQLWKRPAPGDLKTDVDEARRAAEALLARTRSEIQKIPSLVPATFTFQQLAALSGDIDSTLRAPSSDLEVALARLAGQPCRVSQPASS